MAKDFILLLILIKFALGGRLYTVVANQSAEDCSGKKSECSLMYFAAHPNIYFGEDNTTFLFLAGEHKLLNSTLFLIKNLSKVTLRGNSPNRSDIIVACDGENSGGFSFFNITKLTVLNLQISGCSGISSYSKYFSALEVTSCSNVQLYNIQISHTAGFGIVLNNTYQDVLISHTDVEYSQNTSTTKGGNLVFHCSVQQRFNYSSFEVTRSSFTNGRNTYEYGSGGIVIHISCSAMVEIRFDSIEVSNNFGVNGGNIFLNLTSLSNTLTASISIINSIVHGGTATSVGGGLCLFALAGEKVHTSPTSIVKIESTLFDNNTAYHNGGGLYFGLHQTFPVDFGSIWVENCTFSKNTLVYPSTSHGGIGVHIVSDYLPDYFQQWTAFFKIRFTKCYFLEHALIFTTYTSSIPRIGVLYTENAKNITIQSCSFVRNNCSGVIAIKSHLIMQGRVEISDNVAEKGGALYFCSGSVMHLNNGTHILITNNHAMLHGGGIYIDGGCSPAVQVCFFQVDDITADDESLSLTQVHLINNTASAGTAIYGGLIDRCILFNELRQEQYKWDTSRVFNNTFNVVSHKDDLTEISSDPVYIGFCAINSSITKVTLGDCPLNISVSVKPGMLFSVPTVLMGQRYGLVSGLVIARCVNDECNIAPEEYSQGIEIKGSNLTFTVFSREQKNISLEVVADDYFSVVPEYKYTPSYINVHVERCPLGFTELNMMCCCLVGKCNITNQTVLRQQPSWIGYTSNCGVNRSKAIIFKDFCPLGYCIDKDIPIDSSVNYFNQDIQCADHRTGILCGECKYGYTLGLGSTKCLHNCNSLKKYIQYLRIIGILAACSLAGILLVTFLTCLNATVADGTLNGIIFYANVVQENLNHFFPQGTYSKLWTLMIAWLNLDLGINICFYHRMDATAKTWLQFIFPLYIWFISGAIVYFSRRSTRIAQVAGRNAVKVLATLFLLSFGKLIRTVISILLFTKLTSIDQSVNKFVWLLDAKVDYIQKKHLPLFLVGCVTGVIAIMYALMLTFIQCLRRSSWIMRFKPLLDAYTGPYKDNFHYWTGFLLILRIILFLSFALNFDLNPEINFTLIVTVSTLLIIIIQKGIYKNSRVGLLESSLLANLILFSVFSMITVKSCLTIKTVVVYVFGGWTLLSLFGIICFHVNRKWPRLFQIISITMKKFRMCFAYDNIPYDSVPTEAKEDSSELIENQNEILQELAQ